MARLAIGSPRAVVRLRAGAASTRTANDPPARDHA